MNTMKQMKKMWASGAIVLGIALILTAWLPTDLSAGSKGHAFGNKAETGNAGISQIPVEPFKVRSQPGDPIKVLTPSDPIKLRSTPGEPVKVLIPGEPVKVLIPGEPIKVRNTPTDPSASGGNERGIIIVGGKGGTDGSTKLDAKKIQEGIKINPGDAVGLNPQPLPPR